MSLKKLKPLRYALTFFLVIGVILTLGSLAFVSVFAGIGIIGLATLAFFLAGGIEGEVYAQGINEAFKKLFNSHHLRDVICLRTLNELLENKRYRKRNEFLKEYYNLADSIHHAEELAEKNRLDEESEKALKIAKQNLRVMQKYFKNFIFDTIENETQGLNNILKENEKKNILKEISRKTWLSRGILPISSIAGIGMGLVFFNVAPTGIASMATLFGVTLTASALPPLGMAILCIFSVITAAGYMNLIYKALTDVVEKNFSKWWRNIKNYFRKRNEESTLRFAVRIFFSIVGIAAVLGIGIFATITTAGTWWYAAQAGAAVILPSASVIATWVSGIAVTITAVATLIFTLDYSVQSVDKIRKIFSWQFIKGLWEQSKNKILNYWKKENILQFFNPCRMAIVAITLPYKFLMFMGHIIFNGWVGESSKLLPENLSGLTVALNSTSDFVVDLAAHMPDIKKSKKHHKKFHEHNPKTDEAVPDHKKSHSHHRSHGHDGHSHTHIDIPGKFLIFVLSPLYFLSAVWDFCTASPNAKDLKMDFCTLFKRSLIKSFYGIKALDEKKKIEFPTLKENYSQTLSAVKIAKGLNSLPEKERVFFETLKNDFNNHTLGTQEIFKKIEKQSLMSEGGEKLRSKLININRVSKCVS